MGSIAIGQSLQTCQNRPNLAYQCVCLAHPVFTFVWINCQCLKSGDFT